MFVLANPIPKFADDDWLAANGLLASTLPDLSSVTLSSSNTTSQSTSDLLSSAKVRALRLKPVTTIISDEPCETAIEVMRDKGFDQLPVLAPGGKKLAGLITLGNVLSWITHGRATGKSPVSTVMFDFSKISEVVTDPRDVSPIVPLQSNTPAISYMEQSSGAHKGSRKFVEITLDTPLSTLNRFFEWNSAAIVTERDQSGVIKPVAVATKVDLLTWMISQNKA